MTESAPVSNNPFLSPTKIKKTNHKVHPVFKIILGVFLVILIVLIALAGISYKLLYLPGRELYAQILSAQTLENDIKTAVSSRDLTKIREEIVALRQKKTEIQAAFEQLSILGKLPKAKEYYQDGQQAFVIADNSLDATEIIIKAIEPYQDFLGLKGGTATASAKKETAQDRIAFLTDSIDSIVPHFDELEAKLSNIQVALNSIDASRYPQEYRGIKVQDSLLKAQQMIDTSSEFIKNSKPILTKSSWLLGKDKPRTYLLLFQNDTELRPSGGFWTAYGLLKVDKGKITPLVSDDIYSLDAKLKSTIPAPRPIKAYHINVPYWNLRDMNISPDFPTDAQQFISQYNKISGDKFDAIVALTTKPVVDLIRILGRIGVPGWGNFTPDPDKRCDGCPNVLYQMLWIAGRPRNYIELDRKGFLGPLMHSTLSNAMNSPKEKMGPIMESLLTNFNQKHLLMYFNDPEMQKAAVLANLAGAVAQTPNTVDYFQLNDANMASAKTNLFLTQKIKHEIISEGGKVQHKVTVTYTNPSKASNCNLEKGDICLNAPKYRDWFRFYTTQGSKLDKMTGTEVEPVVYDELGKTVFEGFYGDKFPLYAQSSTKTSVQYTSPIAPSTGYTLFLQKQPGTKPVDYELVVNGETQDQFSWVSDKTVKLSL